MAPDVGRDGARMQAVGRHAACRRAGAPVPSRRARWPASTARMPSAASTRRARTAGSRSPVLPLRCAALETVTTREAPLLTSRSRRRFVSRNGARWLTANVCSKPSGVVRRSGLTVPALLTSTSSREWCERNVAASARHRGQRREIAQEQRDPRRARSPRDLLERPIALALVARHHDHVGSQRRDLDAGLEADAGTGAGDEDRLAEHFLAATALF